MKECAPDVLRCGAARHVARQVAEKTTHDRKASETSPIVHVVKFAYDVIEIETVCKT